MKRARSGMLAGPHDIPVKVYLSMREGSGLFYLIG